MHIQETDLSALPPARREPIERLTRLPELVNADEALVRRGRFVTLDFQVVVDDLPCFVSLAEGRVERVKVGAQRMKSCAFVVRASAEAWSQFWQEMPEPWWQDLFAMVKKGNASIDGDLHPFMSNLQYFKDVIASPRRIAARAVR
jgi:hypothetical protein